MKRQFNFMGTARIWFILSLIVTAVGLGSLFVKGLNLGIDYTGGTQQELLFERQDLKVADVREAVRKELGKEPVVKQTEEPGKSGAAFLVTTQQLDAAGRDKLNAALEKDLGRFEILAISEVSGTIRSELLMNALLAVALAVVMQVIYITIRFELRFAVTAVVALVHDVIMTVGLVSLLGVEVGPPFLAAIMTVFGYSVNDTIVIFDRIRENLRKRVKGESLEAMVNRSVNETFVRSVNAVLTTEMSILAILLFGGDSTRDFALTLLIGITSGAYSSIFIASPLWLWWRNWEEGQKRARPALSAK